MRIQNAGHEHLRSHWLHHRYKLQALCFHPLESVHLSMISRFFLTLPSIFRSFLE
jgi:hypothetical protein